MDNKDLKSFIEYGANNFMLTTKEIDDFFIQHHDCFNNLEELYEEIKRRDIIIVPIEDVGVDNYYKEHCEDDDEDSENKILVEEVDDGLKVYLNEMSKVACLSKEDEISLFKQLSNGDVNARNKIIEANLRLVISVAKQFTNRGIPLLDLIQDGNMGLMKAVDKFDYTKGFKFSTYAVYWIKQNIYRNIAVMQRTIRIPNHTNETIISIKKKQAELFKKLNRMPTSIEIAYEIGITANKVEELQNLSLQAISLDVTVGEDSDSLLAEIIPDTEAIAPDDVAMEKALKEEIRKILLHLTDKERDVIITRYGLEDDSKPCTMEETGRKFGITKERVRQIENKAMRRMRHPIYRNRLKDFFQ